MFNDFPHGKILFRSSAFLCQILWHIDCDCVRGIFVTLFNAPQFVRHPQMWRFSKHETQFDNQEREKQETENINRYEVEKNVKNRRA